MLVAAPASPLPLAAIIAEAVSLEDAITRRWFPQARHHARLIVLRAQGAGLMQVAACGLGLLEALNASSLPAVDTLAPVLTALLLAIDRALESTAPA